VADVVALRTDRVDLVEEEDARRGTAGTLKRFVQRLFALAHPHAQHFLDSDGDESGADLSSRRASNMRLAAPRWAVEKDPAPRSLPVGGEQLRLRERVDYLHANLFLHVVHAADVLERDAWALGGERLVVLVAVVLVLEVVRACWHRDPLARGERGGQVRIRRRRAELYRPRVPLPRLDIGPR
jgi:hypothetical protein